jgi:hypothetical protein
MGRESNKGRARRFRAGYFERYLVGKGVGIGCGDDPVLRIV